MRALFLYKAKTAKNGSILNMQKHYNIKKKACNMHALKNFNQSINKL